MRLDNRQHLELAEVATSFSRVGGHSQTGDGLLLGRREPGGLRLHQVYDVYEIYIYRLYIIYIYI